MRVPFSSSRRGHDSVEDGRVPLLALCCLLGVTVAIVVVEVRLGARLALTTGGVAAATLTTRIPRVLAIAAALCLAVAAVAVLDAHGSTATLAAHAVTRSKAGK